MEGDDGGYGDYDGGDYDGGDYDRGDYDRGDYDGGDYDGGDYDGLDYDAYAEALETAGALESGAFSAGIAGLFTEPVESWSSEDWGTYCAAEGFEPWAPEAVEGWLGDLDPEEFAGLGATLGLSGALPTDRGGLPPVAWAAIGYALARASGGGVPTAAAVTRAIHEVRARRPVGRAPGRGGLAGLSWWVWVALLVVAFALGRACAR